MPLLILFYFCSAFKFWIYYNHWYYDIFIKIIPAATSQQISSTKYLVGVYFSITKYPMWIFTRPWHLLSTESILLDLIHPAREKKRDSL